MVVKTLTINDRHISAREWETILEAARNADIHIPTLCHLEMTKERSKLEFINTARKKGEWIF